MTEAWVSQRYEANRENFHAVRSLPPGLEPDTSVANCENRLPTLILNEMPRAVLV